MSKVAMVVGLAVMGAGAVSQARAELNESTAPEPPVRVWLSSNGDYQYGDRAKIYARASADGFLVVLHADASGRVHVVFPIDPQSDDRVRAGKKYELKARGDREAFLAADKGRGTVLAAFSESPFRFDEFEKAGHWDYEALSDSIVKDDPEAGLIEIIQRMQPDAHFDYDVASYVVSPARDARWARHYGWGPGWWGYGYGPPLGWGMAGVWFGPRFYYRPYPRGPFYRWR